MSMGQCRTCGRGLKDYRTCEPDDPALNCGGDCLMCQYGFEEDFPEDVRCTKPRGYDDRPRPAFHERLRRLPQAWRLLRVAGLSRRAAIGALVASANTRAPGSSQSPARAEQ